ncbi:hypothetical protein GCM10009675_34190 [Prauserella alba]|uniref:Uncharacterized protein n=1 Tax=Prauserella alba TaxID=176898 RepID=A0ABN1VIK8_9PSEU
MVEQAHIHGRERGHDRDSAPLQGRERVRDVEAGQQCQACARADRRVQHCGLAERMEQRQRTEDDVGGSQLRQFLGDDLDVLHEIAMGELGTLGAARRSGRVENRGRVARIARCDPADRGRVAGQ